MDQGINGYTGTLGVGFAAATPPELVAAIPEPTTALLATLGLLAFTLPRHRNVCR